MFLPWYMVVPSQQLSSPTRFSPMVYILQEIYKPTPPLADQIHFWRKRTSPVAVPFGGQMDHVGCSSIPNSYMLIYHTTTTSSRLHHSNYLWVNTQRYYLLLGLALVWIQQWRQGCPHDPTMVDCLLCQLWMNFLLCPDYGRAKSVPGT